MISSASWIRDETESDRETAERVSERVQRTRPRDLHPAGARESYSELAARFGVSRARIAQIITTAEKGLATLERAARIAARSNDPLDTPIDLLPLSTRSINALSRYGKRTLSDLARSWPDEILGMKNLGVASLREIQAILRKLGIPWPRP